MSDETLRRHERAAAAAGSVEDQVRCLTEKLRRAPLCERCRGDGFFSDMGHTIGCPICAGAGSLLRARVELAAWCFDPAAQAVTPIYTESDHITGICPCAGCVWDNASTGEWLGWLSGLTRWDGIGPVPGWVMKRAAVTAARATLPAWERTEIDARVKMEASDGRHVPSAYDITTETWKIGALNRLGLTNPRCAVDAAEAWIACPCAKHIPRVDTGDELPDFAYYAVLAISGDPTHALRRACVGVGATSTEASLHYGSAHYRAPTRAPTSAASLIGEGATRDAICASLVSWALG